MICIFMKYCTVTTHKSQPVTCNFKPVFQMWNLNRCLMLPMLAFRCCLQGCCNLQWFKTSASNFGKATRAPSCSNIEFFIKSWHGQASIDNKSLLTIPTTPPTPTVCVTSVLTLAMACAAFYTIKYMTIFYFRFKKQQHLQLRAVMVCQRNGQERSYTLRLLSSVLNTSGVKEYISLVPHVRTNFFLPI